MFNYVTDEMTETMPKDVDLQRLVTGFLIGEGIHDMAHVPSARLTWHAFRASFENSMPLPVTVRRLSKRDRRALQDYTNKTTGSTNSFTKSIKSHAEQTR